MKRTKLKSVTKKEKRNLTASTPVDSNRESSTQDISISPVEGSGSIPLSGRTWKRIKCSVPSAVTKMIISHSSEDDLSKSRGKFPAIGQSPAKRQKSGDVKRNEDVGEIEVVREALELPEDIGYVDKDKLFFRPLHHLKDGRKDDIPPMDEIHSEPANDSGQSEILHSADISKLPGDTSSQEKSPIEDIATLTSPKSPYQETGEFVPIPDPEAYEEQEKVSCNTSTSDELPEEQGDHIDQKIVSSSSDSLFFRPLHDLQDGRKDDIPPMDEIHSEPANDSGQSEISHSADILKLPGDTSSQEKSLIEDIATLISPKLPHQETGEFVPIRDPDEYEEQEVSSNTSTSHESSEEQVDHVDQEIASSSSDSLLVEPTIEDMVGRRKRELHENYPHPHWRAVLGEPSKTRSLINPWLVIRKTAEQRRREKEIIGYSLVGKRLGLLTRLGLISYADIDEDHNGNGERDEESIQVSPPRNERKRTNTRGRRHEKKKTATAASAPGPLRRVHRSPNSSESSNDSDEEQGTSAIPKRMGKSTFRRDKSLLPKERGNLMRQALLFRGSRGENEIGENTTVGSKSRKVTDSSSSDKSSGESVHNDEFNAL